MRRKHLLPAEQSRRGTATGTGALYPTGGATARYENNSHGGTTWYDITANPANGTDGGTAGFWPSFDDDDYVTIGQPSKLDFDSAFTLTAWVKQSIDPPRQDFERILSRDNNSQRSWMMSQNDDTGVFSAFIWSRDSGGGYASLTSSAYDDGEWHFIVLVNTGSTAWDGGANGDLRFYVDGAFDSENVGGGRRTNHVQPIEFGRRQDGDDYYTGQIDTGRLYSRVLSAGEILRDYNAGKPAHP